MVVSSNFEILKVVEKIIITMYSMGIQISQFPHRRVKRTGMYIEEIFDLEHFKVILDH